MPAISNNFIILRHDAISSKTILSLRNYCHRREKGRNNSFKIILYRVPITVELRLTRRRNSRAHLLFLRKKE